MILDAVMAHSEADLNWFWRIREDVHVMVSRCRNDQHFDISLPISAIGDVVEQVLEELAKIPEVELAYPFGHVADGNIHFVISKSEQSKALIDRVNEVIYQPLQTIKGSVSAEHGIGVHKKKYLPLSRSPEEIELMRTLKKAMDPKRILNRGKVVDVMD